MIIKANVLGMIRTNTYLINDEKGNAFIIDPGSKDGILQKHLHECKLKLQGIILTHFHLDHLLGIVDFPDVPIYISKTDGDFLQNSNNLDYMRKGFYPENYISDSEFDTLVEFIGKSDIAKVCEGYEIPNFDETLKVLLTPGHSAGSMCIYAPKSQNIFSGDTLFCRTCGRTDLPTSNENSMVKSLKRLSGLPGDTDVFPGHGPSTTIGEETERGILKF